MPKEKYLEITTAIYNLAEFFPEGEPLKQKLKERALELMENLILLGLSNNSQLTVSKAAFLTLENIEILEGYFKLGKEKGWVDSMNLLILLREFDQIKKEMRVLSQLVTVKEKLTKITEKPPVDKNVDKIVKSADSGKKLSDRQKKIINVLNDKKQAQVADFKKIMPEVSKRTLRRDLDQLLEMGQIERLGEFNQVVYKIRG